jgi:RNA polymerase sigma-70 factor (ECF subfamily)
MHNDSGIQALLQRARSGDSQALGELLETYRSYLRILANQQLYRHLKSKYSASDLVQETFLRAKEGIHRFEGKSEGELLAWLRSILSRQLSNAMRHFATQRRNVQLERRVEVELDQSSQAMGHQLAGFEESPSGNVERRERALLLALALDRLKPEYHEVIELRHLQGAPFSDVAKMMGRSVNSVKQLWARAIAQLRDELREL